LSSYFKETLQQRFFETFQALLDKSKQSCNHKKQTEAINTNFRYGYNYLSPEIGS